MKTAFSVTTRIRATPAQVFGFLADPATASVIAWLIRASGRSASGRARTTARWDCMRRS